MLPSKGEGGIITPVPSLHRSLLTPLGLRLSIAAAGLACESTSVKERVLEEGVFYPYSFLFMAKTASAFQTQKDYTLELGDQKLVFDEGGNVVLSQRDAPVKICSQVTSNNAK